MGGRAGIVLETRTILGTPTHQGVNDYALELVNHRSALGLT